MTTMKESAAWRLIAEAIDRRGLACYGLCLEISQDIRGAATADAMRARLRLHLMGYSTLEEANCQRPAYRWDDEAAQSTKRASRIMFALLLAEESADEERARC